MTRAGRCPEAGCSAASSAILRPVSFPVGHGSPGQPAVGCKHRAVAAARLTAASIRGACPGRQRRARVSEDTCTLAGLVYIIRRPIFPIRRTVFPIARTSRRSGVRYRRNAPRLVTGRGHSPVWWVPNGRQSCTHPCSEDSRTKDRVRRCQFREFGADRIATTALYSVHSPGHRMGRCDLLRGRSLGETYRLQTLLTVSTQSMHPGCVYLHQDRGRGQH